jgi:hypothetical protein
VSISTYAELKTAAANRLKRGDTASYIDDWILLAETDIYRRLRIRDMETAFSTAISGGVCALPSGYIDLKFAYINASQTYRLKRRTNAQIYEKYPVRSSDGIPKLIAREGSNFIFGPYPDSDYTVTGVYYKNLGAVSSSAHALFTSNPDVYLFGTCYWASVDSKDDRAIARWKMAYETALSSAQMSSDKEESSGGGLEMTAG